MNKDGAMDMARTILGALGGFLVAKGYLSAGDVTTLVGSVVGLGSVAWSVWARSGAPKE